MAGILGTQRKLYYRELISRFSHHQALNWNLGEEINNASTAQKQSWGQYFADNDPYGHHIVIHNGSNHYDLLGNASVLTGFSLQTNWADFRNVHSGVLNYLSRSVDAGKPWAVAVDEPGDAQHALRPDADAGNSHVDGRKNALWGTLMAGGWGNEWYFGYDHDHSDLSLDDFRSRDAWWDYTRYALDFFHDNDIPFWEMESDDAISSAANDYGFVKPGEVYAIYLKDGGTTSLDLSGTAGTFDVQWFDPRSGGALQDGSVTQVNGGGVVNLGTAPNSTSEDWAILVTAVESPRLLFIRGGDRTGGFLEGGNDEERTEHLADINNFTTGGGNHGWGQLRNALEGAGFTVEQITEGSETVSGPADGIHIDLETMDLSQYDVLVFGSNNAVYDAAAVDAFDQYIQDGGAALFISDANFGGDWADAPNSDQQFLDLLGITVNQDQGTYVVGNSPGEILIPSHPLFTGVTSFDGEGVSPFSVSQAVPGVDVQLLAGAEGNTRLNEPPFGANNRGPSVPTGPGDASVIAATYGGGRVVGHYDRNTFFNLGGAGTNITRFDNQQYAINLFTWLAEAGEDFDFGDAPSGYPVELPGGARHLATGPRLGDLRDVEPDGQPSTLADGDGSDEDGVMFGSIGVNASVAGVNIDLQNAEAAKVDAWIDFNGDGDWDDAGEQILNSADVVAGMQTLNFVVPSTGVVAGDTFARVRVSSDGGLATTGDATDGEVEDYQITLFDEVPLVEDIVINGGAETRSKVTSLTVTFSSEVDHTALDSAFVVTNITTETEVGTVQVASTDSGGKTTAVLTFSGASTLAPINGTLGTTLLDGNYRLDILAAQVQLASNNAATLPSNFVFGGQLKADADNDGFFRLYGDDNGDGDTNFGDFATGFLPSFGAGIGDAAYNEALDANGDGIVNFADFSSDFLPKFGTSRP